MASGLAGYTDYYDETTGQPLKRLVVRPEVAATVESGSANSLGPAETGEGNPFGDFLSRLSEALGKSSDNLLGLNGKERYQLWPERLVREGLSAAHDVMSGEKPAFAIDPVTGEAHTSPQMIEAGQAMSALAGTGGLGGAGAEAGTALGVVPVDIAKKLNFKSAPANDILTQAVKNTKGASIDADGHLVMNVTRNQHPDQELTDSIRGGVFYLPEGSKYSRYYNGTTDNNYGGVQNIQGQTAFKNPLVVKGQTGGKAPESAYAQLTGNKKAINDLDKEIDAILYAPTRVDPGIRQHMMEQFLDKHAPELSNHTDYILNNANKGNQLRYALREAAIASLARKQGYDGIIGYSTKKTGEPFLSEVFDTRENLYPSPSGDYGIHSQLLSDTSKPAAAIQANRAFLRPALKYGEKLYKGKEGQQHLDLIPADLYPTFQKQAMNGDDISHWNFGFYNDKGHFLTRDKALQYGIDNGIIDPQSGKFGALTSTMMSDSSKPGAVIAANKPFYSGVENALLNAKQGKADAAQWLGYLKNQPGVKQEELQHLGLDKLQGSITKDDLLKAVQEGQPQINTVWRGGITDRENVVPDQIAQNQYKDAWKAYTDKLNEISNNGTDLKAMRSNEYRNLQSEMDGIHDLMVEDTIKRMGGLPTPTKYQDYQLPGGENYREMLLMLPKTEVTTNSVAQKLFNKDMRFLDETQRQAVSDEMRNIHNANKSGLDYKSSHWDEPNVLAHIRMNDRNIDGKKTLHVEEIQSDWHQAGRKQGYKGSIRTKREVQNDIDNVLKELEKRTGTNTPTDKNWSDNPDLNKRFDELANERKVAPEIGSGVPDAPFKKTWDELAIKNVLDHAVKNGYDQVSWTPGEAQAARYDLSKQVNLVSAMKSGDKYTVYIEGKNGQPAFSRRNGWSDHGQKTMDAKELEATVGKEAAEKLINGKPNKEGWVDLRDKDLKIGGEGMKAFYDKMLVDKFNALGKKYGAKVSKTDIEPANKIIKEIDPRTKEYVVKNNGKEVGRFNDRSAAQSLVEELLEGNVGTSSQPVYTFSITPKLREQIKTKGQPLFSVGLPIYTPVDFNPFEDKTK